MGPAKKALTWIHRSIILQMKVESVIISVLLEENANVGLIEEYVESVGEVLKPLCIVRMDGGGEFGT